MGVCIQLFQRSKQKAFHIGRSNEDFLSSRYLVYNHREANYGALQSNNLMSNL